MAERKVRLAPADIRARRDQRIEVVGTTSEAEEAKQTTAQTAQSFLNRAFRDYRQAADASSQRRQNQLEDLEFRDGRRQWDDTSRQERAADGRPCLTINRIPQFVRQVVNAQRAQNLSVKVLPVDDHADVEVAEVFNGIIRNIEQQSDAQVAYSTAAEHQVTIGNGYWKITTEFSDPASFYQEIKIRRIPNPFTVYFDPACREFDFSDARFAFIVEDIPKDEFRARYGDEAYGSLSSFVSIGDPIPNWSPDNAVRVAEYWYVEEVPEELFLIQTAGGEQDTLFATEYETLKTKALEMNVAPPPIIGRRMSKRRAIHMALICQSRILEGNPEKTAGRRWPGKFIPIVPVLGDEIILNGQVDYRGMVRDAKDPQRLYNYQNTALAESLALAPKTPWIGYLGQFKNLEAKWRLANRKNFAYLEVNPTTIDGKVVPLPQRNVAEPPIQAIVMAIGQANSDLQSTMGLYQESLGERSSTNQSGKAITALQKQGEIANSNFLDNLSRAIRHTGRILIDLIPTIYDAPRVVRFMGLDEQENAVIVHSGQGDAAKDLEEFYQQSGIKGVFDLNAGRFDVAVSSGPSTATKREAAAEALNGLIQAVPEAFPLIGDLLVANLDFPGSQAAAKRLKAMVPPAAMGEEGGDFSPQAAQQQIAQLTQMAQELQAQNQQLLVEQQSRLIEAETRRLDTQARVEMAKLQAQIDLLTNREDNETKLLIEQLRIKVKAIETLAAQAHEIDVNNQAAHHDGQRQMRDHLAQAGTQMRDHQAAMGTQVRDHLAAAGSQVRDHAAKAQSTNKDQQFKAALTDKTLAAKAQERAARPRPGTKPTSGAR